MSTLVILAHPALHRSRINSKLAEVAISIDGVSVLDLYEHYPDFDIDVKTEQKRLIEADALILQHPFYWYSMPALLKEWIDLVFEHGFAYGNETQKLRGKILSQAISTGGDEESYAHDGFNRFSIEELLRPLEATAHFCAMSWHKPYVTHGGHIITDNDIEKSAQEYHKWLTSVNTITVNKGNE